jgi:hypothetical protein
MKPGQIRVFDGLRLTTEHVEHLQGALHSALQDVREILGLGKVYRGFEVVAAGTETITVQPGLAFDFQKNRLVCDEPQSIKVAFGPDEEAQYVCLKYDQTEDREVEGHFTLIWDSCSVVLQPTLPEPKDNLVPIARLTKAGDGSLQIISLSRSQNEDEATEGTDGVAESSESVAVLSMPRPNGARTEVKPGTALATPTPRPGSWRLHVQQGVTRLAAIPGTENYLNTTLAAALRRTLSTRNGATAEELRFGLAEAEVALNFAMTSLTCQTILSGIFSLTQVPHPTEVLPTSGGAAINTSLKVKSTANGEATFVDDGVTQFGLSTMQCYSDAGVTGAAWCQSDLTERGIAHLSLDGWLQADGTNLAAARDILQYLQLLIRVDKSSGRGFKVVCNLLWNGGVSEEIIQKIEGQKPNLTWSTLVAWKALGE